MSFTKANKKQSKLRLAISGPSGSGKTYTSLIFGRYIATELGGKLAVIDTERGSASKYAGQFDFDCMELQNDYSLDAYTNAIKEAEAQGYSVLIIDSLSHSWSGRKGALEMVDDIAKRSNSGNSFAAWKKKLHHFLTILLTLSYQASVTLLQR